MSPGRGCARVASAGFAAGRAAGGQHAIHSLADLGNSFDVVKGTRCVPFTLQTVLQLAVATLLPVLPLTLTMISLEELLGRLLKLVFRRWSRLSRRRDTRRSTRYPSRVDRDEIIRVLRAFEASGLEYVLIGAAAMGFHGLVRATEDLDLFVRATSENIERLRAALREAYEDDPHIDEISSADLLGEYPAVRYYPPTGDLYFDVLTRLGDAARFETVDAEIKDIEGTRVRVATPAALYRLKKGTVRAIDHQDAAALRERFNLTDEG